MLELLKGIFKLHRGAVTAIALIHIFTFIPAAMIFWLEETPNIQLVYYAFIAAVAVITSWTLHWVTRDVRANVKHYFIKMEIIFVVTALLAAPFLLTAYFSSAIFFANFFEQFYPNVYTGPNRAVSAVVIFVFYNMFFYADLFRGIKSGRRQEVTTQK